MPTCREHIKHSKSGFALYSSGLSGLALASCEPEPGTGVPVRLELAMEGGSSIGAGVLFEVPLPLLPPVAPAAPLVRLEPEKDGQLCRFESGRQSNTSTR